MLLLNLRMTKTPLSAVPYIILPLMLHRFPSNFITYQFFCFLMHLSCCALRITCLYLSFELQFKSPLNALQSFTSKY